MYHNPAMGIGWMFALSGVVLLVLILIAGLAFSQFQRPGAGDHASRPDAERTLADRLARGEIEVEEYEQRLRALRAAPR
jgi:putative membrane protein